MAWKFSFPKSSGQQKSRVIVCRLADALEARQLAESMSAEWSDDYGLVATEIEDDALVLSGLAEGECRVVDE